MNFVYLSEKTQDIITVIIILLAGTKGYFPEKLSQLVFVKSFLYVLFTLQYKYIPNNIKQNYPYVD